jgi:site-specific recombinase XerD
MLAGKQLEIAYQDYIINYSAEKALEKNSIKNKSDILDGLIPFLNGNELNLESCRNYIKYKYEHGWTKPNSRRNVAKYVRAFINFLYDREYIEKNFAKKIVIPKAVPFPEPLPDIDQAEKVILAGTEPGKYDHAYHCERKALMRFALQFALRTFVMVIPRLKCGIWLDGGFHRD